MLFTMLFAVDVRDNAPPAKAELLRLTMPSGYTRPSTFGAGGFGSDSVVGSGLTVLPGMWAGLKTSSLLHRAGHLLCLFFKAW